MARCPVGTDTSFTVFDKDATLDDGQHITARTSRRANAKDASPSPSLRGGGVARCGHCARSAGSA